MPTLKPQCDWLRAASIGKPIGVDREAKVIRGYIAAERGPFKSDGRGEFDDASLSRIEQLWTEKPAGLKARFTHPSLSGDGLGSFLGRSKNGRRDGNQVRADLHFDDSAFRTPQGDLASYVMDLAESDPTSFGSSLVLQAEKTFRLDDKGRPVKGNDGEPLPPLWMPTKLHASDIVDEGDAVHTGFLSVAEIDWENLPDAAVRQGAAFLDSAFPGVTREVLTARVQAWLSRYCELRYGVASDPKADPAHLRRRMEHKIRRAKFDKLSLSD